MTRAGSLRRSLLEGVLCSALQSEEVQRHILAIDYRGSVVVIAFRLPEDMRRLRECLRRMASLER